jgi:hypothetical protein
LPALPAVPEKYPPLVTDPILYGLLAMEKVIDESLLALRETANDDPATYVPKFEPVEIVGT